MIKLQKPKSLKLKAQNGKDEKWTAKTWYTLAHWYEAMSDDRTLPTELRDQFYAQAEAARVTGDLLRGITPEMWAEQCRQEDEAFQAYMRGEVAQSPSDIAEEEWQRKQDKYTVRTRARKPRREKIKKVERLPQLELELA